MLIKRSCEHWSLSQWLVMKHIYRCCGLLYLSSQDIDNWIICTLLTGCLNWLWTAEVQVHYKIKPYYLSRYHCAFWFEIKLNMNHDGLEQNIKASDLVEILSYTRQSLVITYQDSDRDMTSPNKQFLITKRNSTSSAWLLHHFIGSLFSA